MYKLFLDSKDHSLNEVLHAPWSRATEGRRKSEFCARVGSDERNTDEYGIKISSSVLQFRSTSHLASLSTCVLLQGASSSLFFEFCCCFALAT